MTAPVTAASAAAARFVADVDGADPPDAGARFSDARQSPTLTLAGRRAEHAGCGARDGPAGAPSVAQQRHAELGGAPGTTARTPSVSTATVSEEH